jgi:hydroxymethylbilane synthase
MMKKKRWIIGTRGSKLALKQTEMVMNQLVSIYPGCRFAVKTIKTTGDTVWDKPLQTIGEKGLFVKEIEDELRSGDIDLAVHSMKDLPTELPPGLAIGAVLKREDPRDAFLSLNRSAFSEITAGSRIGTNSLRRKSQILHHNRGIIVIPIRGNIDTRIKKIGTMNLDGIVLALAGLKRMGLEHLAKEILPLDLMVPPSGQGAIGVETRDDREARDFLEPIDDTASRDEVTIERDMQTMIGGGCTVPLGINAAIRGGHLTLRASYGDENGVSLIKVEESGRVEEAREIMLRALRHMNMATPSD